MDDTCNLLSRIPYHPPTPKTQKIKEVVNMSTRTFFSVNGTDFYAEVIDSTHAILNGASSSPSIGLAYHIDQVGGGIKQALLDKGVIKETKRADGSSYYYFNTELAEDVAE